MRVMMTALVALLAAGAARAAPLETYSKLPVMRMPVISPDGSKVAFVQSVQGKEALVIDQLNPPAVLGNIPPGKLHYQSLTWVDSTHLAAQQQGFPVQLVDLDKRKVGLLGEKTEVRGVNRPPVVRTRDGRTTIFIAGYMTITQREGATVLEAVDFATGGATRLARVEGAQAVEWYFDPAGNVVGQTMYDQKKHVWTLQVRRGADWIDSYSVTALIDPPEVVGLTLDGKNLVLRRITEDHGLEFRSVSLQDGKLGDLVPEYDGLNQVIYDPQTHRPIGGTKMGIELTYVFFDPKDRALWDGVLKLFPDEEVELASWTEDRSKVVVRVTGLKHGVSYYVVDTAAHTAMGIGPAFEGIEPKDLSDIEMVTYPAKDGLPIQALLTLPNGRPPQNLPLVVLPHGGPESGDLVGYNAFAQALASRG